jgi:hypothetical protein
MSITVKTGKTTSDYFAVTKTITNETQRTISLVYPCDMLAPTVSIKGGRIDANYLTGLFGRKYWITNQTVDKGITYLHCSVDAWASWSSDIYGSEQFVERSETDYNVYLPDGQFPLPNKNEIDMYDGNAIVKSSSQVKHVIGVI